MNNKNTSTGFVLPTVVIASLVLMAVLVVSLQATVSIRSSIADQYYQQLARSAAESGLARAKNCLSSSNYIAQWSGSNKLYPHTSCMGAAARCTDPADAAKCYVMKGNTERTWYEVAVPVRSGATQTVAVRGVVDVVSKSGGTIRRTVESSLKSRVGADINFSTVTFGYNTSGSYFSAIGDDGSMYTVGYNADGQLGNGTTASSTQQSKFILNGKRAVSAYASFLSLGFHTYAITDDGSVYASGRNEEGQLGIGRKTTSVISIPEKVNLGTKSARFVAPLVQNTFFVTTDGKIMASGDCDHGLLGVNYTLSGCLDRPTPIEVHLPSTEIPTNNFVVDRLTAYVLTESGAVYGWGNNDYGNFANYSYTPESKPIVIGGYNGSTKKARNIGFDGKSIYIVDVSGDVYAAGAHDHGQLGHGEPATTAHYRSLQKMSLSLCSAGKAVKVSTDQWSVSVLMDNGDVCSAGLNSRGQLGYGDIWHKDTPVKFKLPTGVKAVDVYNTSTGDSNPNANNVFVIGDNGKVYGAGANNYGQLGNGSTASTVSTPVEMLVFDGVNLKAEKIQSGYGTTVILGSDKKIYTVGNNSHGQLGDGTTTNSSTPKANKFTNIVPVLYY